MNKIFEYATVLNSDTLHLKIPDTFLTLCGKKPIGIIGDETVSGIAAGCDSCLRKIKEKKNE